MGEHVVPIALCNSTPVLVLADSRQTFPQKTFTSPWFAWHKADVVKTQVSPMQSLNVGCLHFLERRFA